MLKNKIKIKKNSGLRSHKIFFKLEIIKFLSLNFQSHITSNDLK